MDFFQDTLPPSDTTITASSVPATVVERNASQQGQQPFPALLQQNSKIKSTEPASPANFVAAEGADQAKTNGVQHLLHTLSETESNEDQDWKPEIPFGNVRMEF